MTLAQLKRHMDRRFDRLQRTKADKADLARFATKDDFKRFATKEDFQGLPTKEDYRFLLAEMNRRFDSLNDKIDSVLRFARTTAQEHRDRLDLHDMVLEEHGKRLTDLERGGEPS